MYHHRRSRIIYPEAENTFQDYKKQDEGLKKTLSRGGGVHGFKYLFDDSVSLLEKLFWLVVIICALIGAACHLQTIWRNYGKDLTRTTIISTYFKYASISFPSVTICDSSRVDWLRFEHTQLNETLYNIDSSLRREERTKLKNDLRNLLAALSIAQFGAPKDLEHVKNVYGSSKLDNLHISRLLLESARSCNQTFVEGSCWWDSVNYSCCSLFELQKTGYGYCYSFNSDISEKSKVLSLNYGRYGWRDWNDVKRPRQNANHGPTSGVKFRVKTQPIPSYVKVKPGVVVIIGDPSGFPFENDLFVGSGKVGQIGVWGDAVATTDRLEKLPVSKRRCLFPHEKRILHRGYLRQNCIANCYRMFVQSSCECSLDFIYYQIESINGSKYPPCKMKDLKCLAEYNYAFNNLLIEDSMALSSLSWATPSPSSSSSSKLRTQEQLMVAFNEHDSSFCKCPDDCRNQKYVAKLRTRPLDENNVKDDELECDVHFERSFGTLYETDIAFDFVESIVAYGSIAALFLGASLLSVVEIIYHVLRKFIDFIHKQWTSSHLLSASGPMSNKINDSSRPANVLNVSSTTGDLENPFRSDSNIKSYMIFSRKEFATSFIEKDIPKMGRYNATNVRFTSRRNANY